MIKKLFRPAALLLLLVPVLACGGSAPPPEPAAERVESGDLGLVIAALPEPFEVVKTEGGSIELSAPGANGPGTVRILVGEPSASGINLVDAATARKSAFEAAEGGKFYGNRSLGGSLGNIFTARGAYLDESGAEVEETWAYALHPLDKSRMLSVIYTYPPGESQERVTQLMYLLGEIEGLG